MILKIRLARFGKKKKPYYKIVVANSHSPRNGRFIDIIGSYNPLSHSVINLHNLKNKVSFWTLKGAQTTTRIKKILGNVKR